MASLNGTQPRLQQIYAALAQYASSIGVGIGVADYGGIRTQADTARIVSYRQADFNAAVNAGQIPADTSLNVFRPIAPFGQSYHNYGAAFDVAILSRPAGMSETTALATLGAYAPQVGLRWGGTFHNADYPHFELAIPLSQAQAAYEQLGGTASAAPGSLGLPSLSDLANFLPSLTPMDQPAADLPLIDDAGFPPVSDDYESDDSGDAAVADTMPSDSFGFGIDPTVMVLGAVVAGLVLWAVRRQFR